MRRALLRELQNALANGEFALAYQPIVNLRTGRVRSCEALLRWHHPIRGVIPPAEFIPILESSELIIPVGEWVLRQACKEALHWPAHVRVSVNVSVVQFNRPDFVDQVGKVLADTGFSGRRLELELTESVLLEDSTDTLARLRELHAISVNIALDDFGTGYSSLAYLRNFPFDAIKIDRCFISPLSANDQSSLAIIRGVTQMASTLGIETTAEGVETHAQLEIVRSEGCTSAQGFFLHRPLPALAIRNLLSANGLISQAPFRETQDHAELENSSEAERLQALEDYAIMDSPPEESFERIARLARILMNAPVAMISFVDRDRQWFKSHPGTDVGESARDTSFCTHTIQSDEPFIVQDSLLDSRFRDSHLVKGPSGVRSYIGVPLRTSTGHRIGALCINDVNPRGATDDQLAGLQDLAALVMDELELRKLAARDSLTGAATRRVFVSQGQFAFKQSSRHGRELSCIVFDLDHFKQINDTYGHAAGDAVLRAVGNLTKSLIRSTDILGRIGGEEFGIVLPETPSISAATIGELIRKNIGLLAVKHNGHQISVTASCGIASLGSQDQSFASMLARADAAMYEAKAAGRNNVVAKTPLTFRGFAAAG
jgi:diguanylate cyclase (GGDEF)-like protein